MTRQIMVRAITLGAFALMMFSVRPAAADDACIYKGKTYSHGATACQSGKLYECDDGEWESRDKACQEDMGKSSKGGCEFGGIRYSAGAAKCQDGRQYRCDDGEWERTDARCPVGDAPVRVIPSGRTCMFDGATVAHNSAICRSGETFVCVDGEWVNLGTECR